MKISFSAIRQFAITQTGSKSNDIHCIFAGIGDIAPALSVVDPQVATLALAQMLQGLLQGLPQGRDARLRFRVIRAALSGSGFQQCGRDAGRSGLANDAAAIARADARMPSSPFRVPPAADDHRHRVFWALRCLARRKPLQDYSTALAIRSKSLQSLQQHGAAAWPLAARAQQGDKVRRIGVLLPAAADDTEFQARLAAFHQGLALLGWNIGRNVRTDTRWATANAAEIRRHAAELAALAPDVILAHGTSTVGPLLQVTRTVPIVFPVVSDPVAAGFVDSLARPGGNATGFMTNEYGMAGKWLELLKEIVPSVTRVAVLRDTTVGSATSQFAAIQAVAPLLRVEVNPVNMRDAPGIEYAVAAFARADGSLIVPAGPAAWLFRDLIVTLAARHKLPAVYFDRSFVAAGGLVSYGADEIDQYRRAASYVDRILKGEKPADLPVQAPVKYELVVNLKTAKAQGIVVPDMVLGRADEIIE